MSRDEKILQARAMKAEGFTAVEIGERLGASDSTVRNWCLGGTCKCGRPTDGSNAEKSSTCRTCRASRHADRNAQIVEMWNAGEPTWFIAEKLGVSETHVQSYVDRARRLHGVSVDMRRLPPAEKSERFALIARWIQEGKTNREIAGELGTTPGSVENMVYRARRDGFDMPYRVEVVA